MHGTGWHAGSKAIVCGVAMAALGAGAPAWGGTGAPADKPAGQAEAAVQVENTSVMLFPIVKGGKWGYMDEKGKVVIEPQYDAAYDFSEGLACVIVNNWRGFIDRTGAMAIKPDLAWAGRFTDGFAPVYNEKSGFAGRPQFYKPTSGRFCCIDRTGKVQPFGCSTAGFREGKTVADRKRCIGTDGKEIKHDAEELHLFSEGLAGARKGGTWGFLDHAMTWAIAPQFHAVDQFSEGLAAVAKADTPPPESGPGWEWLKRRKLIWGFCDKSGKLVVDYQFEDAWPYAEGLASVRKGGKWGYCDKTGRIVIEPAYDHAWPFSEGRGRVLLGEKQGFIDKSGAMVIHPQFTPAWEFSRGLARVGVKDGEGCKEGYIDPSGKYVWEPTR